MREEAADDLECPEEDLTVERTADGAFSVTGCGLKARYTCSRDGLDDSLCTRTSLTSTRLPSGSLK